MAPHSRPNMWFPVVSYLALFSMHYNFAICDSSKYCWLKGFGVTTKEAQSPIALSKAALLLSLWKAVVIADLFCSQSAVCLRVMENHV